MPDDSSKSERTYREGTRMVAAHVNADAFKEIKHLTADLGTNTDLLLHEALALTFIRHGRPVPTKIEEKLDRHGVELPSRSKRGIPANALNPKGHGPGG